MVGKSKRLFLQIVNKPLFIILIQFSFFFFGDLETHQVYFSGAGESIYKTYSDILYARTSGCTQSVQQPCSHLLDVSPDCLFAQAATGR